MPQSRRYLSAFRCHDPIAKPAAEEAGRWTIRLDQRSVRRRPTIIESHGMKITLTDTQSDPTELER
jgi:hypothetical protein